MPEGVIGNVHEGLVIVAVQQVYDLGIPHPGIGGDLLFFLQVRFRSRFWINCFIGKEIWLWQWFGRCEIDAPLPKSALSCLAIRLVCAAMSRRSIYRRMCRVLGAYNGRDCSRVNIVRMPRDQILRSNIENPVRMPFGGMEVWAPRDVESYLRHHYPNLRPDLPEEEQINHAPYRLSFDTTKEEE